MRRAGPALCFCPRVSFRGLTAAYCETSTAVDYRAVQLGLAGRMLMCHCAALVAGPARAGRKFAE